MRKVKIRVDPTYTCGRIRNILGINNSPTLCADPRRERQQELFRALHPACVRHHDAPIDNRLYAVIDVSRIFPLFHLDEEDPDNYDFRETDDYLSMIAEFPIEFRLGETIDHSGYSRRVNPPADYEKWARICRNILRHYKEGWAKGMFLTIDRVSVWEEPDTVPQLFTGSPEQYYELYVTTYRVLHGAFPNMLIGGPNCSSRQLDVFEGLLVRCQQEGIEPGFFGFTGYNREVETLVGHVEKVRCMLDRYGFYDTGITLTEWHLGSFASNGLQGDFNAVQMGFEGAESAAFSASALIRLLDTPVDLAFFYAWITGTYGLIKVDPEGVTPRPVYYALKYFVDLTQAKARLAVDVDSEDGISVLAAEMGDGRVRLLISAYDTASAEFICFVPGFSTCTVKQIGNEEPAEVAVTPRPVEADAQGCFHTALLNGGSGVFLLEFSA